MFHTCQPQIFVDNNIFAISPPFVEWDPGTKPCLTCWNVFGRVDASDIADGGVSIAHHRRADLKCYSNCQVFNMYDRIAATDGDDLKHLQQCFGLKVNIHGIMADGHIRTFYKPVDHMIRDPMHVLISNGVANVHIANLMRALRRFKKKGKWIEQWQSFLLTFTLPHKHGSVDKSWIARNRFGKKFAHLSSFAGLLLTLIPIVDCWLSQVVKPGHPLHDHAVCFKLLASIVGLCFLGPDDSVSHVEILEKMIEQYIALYVRVYPTAPTPKLHQLLHIPDNIRFLGKLLSCFVTERKHRAAKRASLFVFRGIDNTVISSMVSRQCDAVAGPSSLFDRTSLINPTNHTVGRICFKRAKSALLPCGVARAGDVVYLIDDRVGHLDLFWGSGDHICAKLEMYTNVGDRRWSTVHPTQLFVHSDAIMDCVMYSRIGDEIFIIPPFRSQLQYMS
jgi:hypothetical protein